jgi:hypothetical protein
MGFEVTRSGKARYVHKHRVNGRVVTKVLGSGVAGRIAHEAIVERRNNLRKLRADDFMRQSKLSAYDSATKTIIEQTFICAGYINRNSQWRSVEKLRKKLTPQEKAHINHVKSVAIPKPKPATTSSPSASHTSATNFKNHVRDSKMTKNETLEPLKRLRELDNRLLNPDEVDEACSILRAEPEVWRIFGDTNLWMREESLGDLDTNTLRYQAICVAAEQMRKSLAPLGCNELQSIIAEQIINSWVQTGLTGKKLETIDPSLALTEEGKFYERRHNLAHSRLMKAMALMLRIQNNSARLEQVQNPQELGNPNDKFYCYQLKSEDNEFDPETGKIGPAKFDPITPWRVVPGQEELPPVYYTTRQENAKGGIDTIEYRIPEEGKEQEARDNWKTQCIRRPKGELTNLDVDENRNPIFK